MRAETFDPFSPTTAGSVLSYYGRGDENIDNVCKGKTIPHRLLTEHCHTLPLYNTSEDDAYDSISSVIGPYRIIRELGRGGMGAVYHAHDQNNHSDVALKVIDTRIMQDTLQALRFDSEAGMASIIHHPHVIRIYEHGFIDDYAYLSLQLLPGKTLKQRNGYPIKPDQALKYMMQLASALDAIHAHGIVHHDVKPSNILFSHTDDLVLADFGVSRKLTAKAKQNDRPVGTPAYMSPEQFLGQPTDERSDLYSMGIVLYEILTGYLPWQKLTTKQLYDYHAAGDTPDIPRSAPPVIADLLRGLLASNPAERIASAARISEQLRHAHLFQTIER